MKPKNDSGSILLLFIALFFVFTQCSKPGKTAKDVNWDLVDKLMEHHY